MRKTHIIPEPGGGCWVGGGAEITGALTGRGGVEGLGQFQKEHAIKRVHLTGSCRGWRMSLAHQPSSSLP